jgi:cation diffusion facilitator family transporter
VKTETVISALVRGDDAAPRPVETARARIRVRAMLWSLLFAGLLLAVKFIAYAITRSNAVLSDAFESIVNVAASGFALYTVWVAAQPADASHPYGHGKAEAYSAGFEGGLIVLAGAAIVWGAVPALWAPAPITHIDVGLVLVAAAGVVNLVLGRFLVRTGRRTGSIALEADGHHVLSDSLTTAGVMVGLGIVRVTGWLWVDAVVAIVIGLHLLRVGTGLAGHAVANLMDRADPGVLAMIAQALARARPAGWIEVHRLRSWRTGSVHHVDFHLTLPRFWDLEHAHAAEHVATDVVREVLQDHADVIVHLDPCVPACCSYCPYEPCPVREAPFAGLREWSAETLVQTAQAQRAPDPAAA